MITGLAALCSGNLFGATVVVTGWNQDVIYENDSSPEITESIDGGLGGFTFTEDGLFIAPTVTVGLPGSGTVTSESINAVTNTQTDFTLQSYSSSNALLFDKNSSLVNRTLTLSTPASYSSLHFLDTAGDGTKVITLTLNFTDSTSATTQFYVYNWAQDTNTVALGSLNRTKDISAPVGTDPDSVDTGNGPIWNLFENAVDLTTLGSGYDQKLLSSIVFEIDQAGPNPNGNVAIFAVSGVTVPEPSAIAMLGVGLVLFGFRRARDCPVAIRV